jgi:hypothetical protein
LNSFVNMIINEMQMCDLRYVLLVHYAHVFVVGRLHRSRAELPSSITGNARHAAMGE